MAKPNVYDILEKARNGDENAFNELVTTYFRHIIKYANKIIEDYDLSTDELDDLFQVGVLTLYEKLDDPHFPTLIFTYLQRNMYMYAVSCGKSMCIPGYLGYGNRKNKDIIEATKTYHLGLADTPYDLETDIIDKEVIKENIGLISTILDERDYDIIYGRYFVNRTCVDLGRQYNVTKERVSQLEVKAIHKLREYFGIPSLEPASIKGNRISGTNTKTEKIIIKEKCVKLFREQLGAVDEKYSFIFFNRQPPFVIDYDKKAIGYFRISNVKKPYSYLLYTVEKAEKHYIGFFKSENLTLYAIKAILSSKEPDEHKILKEANFIYEREN